MNWQGKNVVIIGDIMLDKYVIGATERISPEAPVPVIHIKEEKIVPGGAANTANNVASLEGRAILIGVVGNDYAKDALVSELTARKVNTHGLVIDNSRKTMQKIRLVSRKQQLARMDYEDVKYITKENVNQMLSTISNEEKIDCFIISDYAKGTVTKELIDSVRAIAKLRQIPLIVDPRPAHSNWYKGVSLITPNLKETEEMTGIKILDDHDVERAGHILMSALDCNVAITLGEKGMVLFEKGKIPIKIPTFAREVFDVSGAGDTVVATMALALCSGYSMEEACKISNHAAGVVVGKFGTATATRSEIEASVAFHEGSKITASDTSRKIRTRDELTKIILDLRSKGKKVGYTSGAFDLLHAGHVDYLYKAKSNCDVLVLGLNSDQSIKKYKDPNRPINTWSHRAKTIAGLEPVDYVFSFEETNNNVNIETLRPDFYIKAGDYTMEKLSSASIIEKYGGKVVLIPVEEDTSTTKTIKKLMELEKIKEDNENKQKGSSILLPKSKDKIRAIFLDRDGTICEDTAYLHEPSKFVFTPNAIEGMKKLQNLGYKLMIITDQPGIGLGYFSKEDFYKLNGHMFKQLVPHGVQIDKIYFCPHGLTENCPCKKPKPGLLNRAMEDYSQMIDLENSYFVGDKTSDIKCGLDFGVKSVLVRTGSAGKDGRNPDAVPTFVANDLLDVANKIESKIIGSMSKANKN